MVKEHCFEKNWRIRSIRISDGANCEYLLFEVIVIFRNIYIRELICKRIGEFFRIFFFRENRKVKGGEMKRDGDRWKSVGLIF